MFLFLVVLLSIVVHFAGASKESFYDADPKADRFEHLCDKVMSGRLTDINLKSITFNGSDNVVILEGNNHYVIEVSKITTTTLEVPEKYYPLNENFTKSQLDLENRELVKSEYIFKQNGGKKMFITSNEFRYAFQVDNESHAEKMNNETLPRGQPDYAIAHDQGNDDSWGYVIHKDIKQGTNNYVIYQLWVNGWSMELQRANATAEQKKHFHQYHLKRTDNPAEAVLVHSFQYDSTKPDLRNELFSSLPRGFVLHKQLYLFDTDLGCVHIIKQWNRPDLAQLHRNSTGNIIKERVIVPYEEFFKCPQQYVLPDNSSRHNFTHPVNRFEFPAENKLETSKGKWIFYIALGAFCCVAFAVACLILIRCLIFIRADGPIQSIFATMNKKNKTSFTANSVSEYQDAVAPPPAQK